MSRLPTPARIGAENQRIGSLPNLFRRVANSPAARHAAPVVRTAGRLRDDRAPLAEPGL